MVATVSVSPSLVLSNHRTQNLKIHLQLEGTLTTLLLYYPIIVDRSLQYVI